MNDQQPTYKPPSSAGESVATTPADERNANIKLPVVLMAWPAVVFVAAIVLYALTAYLTSQFSQANTSGGGDELFESQNAFTTIVNVVLFLIGALSVTIGPISFISGLVLLTVRLKDRNKKTTA